MTPQREVRLAQAALQKLFAEPPAELATLDEWLAGRPAAPVRESLLDLLGDDRVPTERHALCAYLLWRLGVASSAHRLATIALDGQLSFASRAVALSVLSEHDADRAAEVLEQLEPHDHLRLQTAPVDDLLNAAIETGEGDCLRRMLAELPPPARLSLYDRLEARRQERGMPAHRLYAMGLGGSDLGALSHRMLDRIWEEDPMAAITELQSFAHGEADPDLRARAARAQMRLRSAAMSTQGRVPQPRGWAYVTGCDGVGDYLLFLCIAKPEGIAIYDLMVRASGGLREAECIPGVVDREVEWVVTEQAPPAFSPILRVPLEGAVALLTEANPVHRIDPQSNLAPLTPLLRTLASRRGYELPTVEPESNADELLRLLETRPFAGWRLSPGDVLVHGVSVPHRMSRRAFLRQLQSSIARSAPLAVRLATMARHMSRVHLWRGDVPAARVLEAAALECEKDLGKAPLFGILVDRLFDEVSGRRPRDRMRLGSPTIRAALRSSLLVEIERPRKADLLRLDLVEVTCAALDEALDLVPRERRPRDGELLDLVNVIGTRYADALLGNTPRDPVWQLLSSRLVATIGIDEFHAGELTGIVQKKLEEFTKNVCGRCSVGCLAKPKTPCSQKFHADRHPAADLLG